MRILHRGILAALVFALSSFAVNAALPKFFNAKGGGEALQAARQSGKPVMVYFWQQSCGWCTLVEKMLATSDISLELVQHYHFVNVNTRNSGDPVVEALMKMLKVKGTPNFAFLTPRGVPICMVFGTIRDERELLSIHQNVLAMSRGAEPTLMTREGFASCRGVPSENDANTTDSAK